MYGLKWNGLQDKLVSQVWRQEGQELKVILKYTTNLRLVWVTQGIFKNKPHQNRKIKTLIK